MYQAGGGAEARGPYINSELNHDNEWVHLKTGKEFSRILYPNPVCLLSTIGTSPLSSPPAAERAVSNAASDSKAFNKTYPYKHSEKDIVQRNVMVISWLTPTNNQGRFMFSINKSRYSTSSLCPNSRNDEDEYMNHFRTGIEFTLSVPVRGMENLVLDVGSVSGRFGSKFPSSIEGENDAAHKINAISSTPDLSKRQRKKQRKQQLSLHGVAGLIPVPIGSHSPRSETSPSSMFAIKGTVAHLQCRTYAVIGTPAKAEPSTEITAKTEGRNKDGAVGSLPIIDDGHLVVMAEVTDAHVHPSYWDGNKLLFCALPTKDVPPYLTFLGSQTFGHVLRANVKNST